MGHIVTPQLSMSAKVNATLFSNSVCLNPALWGILSTVNAFTTFIEYCASYRKISDAFLVYVYF